MNRNNLSNHHRTTIFQHLPDNLFEKQQEFLAFVIYRWIQYDYFLIFISNIDKTLIIFNLFVMQDKWKVSGKMLNEAEGEK